MADDPRTRPGESSFDGPSMTYPQRWKSLPSPPPVAPQAAPDVAIRVRRPLWMTIVLLVLVLAIGMLTALIVQQ